MPPHVSFSTVAFSLVFLLNLNNDSICGFCRSKFSAKFPQVNLQPPQQNLLVPIMQECVDAISEHQRLQVLMKGEWVKGLLPHSSVRADYTVQRIRGI